MSATNDLGAPISYLVLAQGTPVYAADGEKVGRVAHVLAVDEEDVFDGIVIEHRASRHRFADADQIDAIHERGVLLALSSAEADALPEPSANPAAMTDDPAADDESGLTGKLRRAWDLLSGDY